MSVLGFGVGVGRMFKAATASPAPPDFPSTGLVAAWSFDDTLTDSVGSKVLTASGGDSYVTGKLGTKALQLTSGNSATVTTDAFNYITSPFSCAVWLKVLPADNAGVWYGISAAWKILAAQGVDVTANADGDGYAPVAQDVYAVPADTWTFCCMRFDGTDIFINVNARTKQSQPCTTLSDQTGGSFNLYAGSYDGLYIWSRCLTDQEVSDLYNSGSGLTP